MYDTFLYSSDSSTIVFNILVLLFLLIVFNKNKKYIPVLFLSVYLFLLTFLKLSYQEAYTFNRLLSITFFIIYIVQKRHKTLRTKTKKYIYLLVLIIFLPYLGLLNAYNSSFLRQTFFAFSTLGFVLLYNPLFFKRGRLWAIVIFIVNVTSLAKWLIVYYLKSILFLLNPEKISFKQLAKGFVVLIIGYYILNSSVKLAGYETIDAFILRRVTKIEVQNYEQQHILGISDGNRINIAVSQFSDFINSRKVVGLGLGYSNVYGVNEHNIFIFLLTRFGLIGIIIAMAFVVSIFKSYMLNKHMTLFYLHIILVFNVGEYYGSSLAIFSIIVTHYLLSSSTNHGQLQ